MRVLPGTEEAALADIRRIVGDDVDVEVVHQDIGLEVPFSGDLVDAMVAALGRHDPGAPVIPYLMGGGTDNKALADARHRRATASRRCAFRPISTSPACSTASTSASRSTRSSSARLCSPTCSAPTEHRRMPRLAASAMPG